MHLLKFIPIKLTFFLVMGILFGAYFMPGIPISLGIVVFLLSVLAYFFFIKNPKKSLLFTISASLTTLGIGLLSWALSHPENYADHYSNQNYTGLHPWKIKIREVMKPTNFSNRYVVRGQDLEKVQICGNLLLNVPKNSVHPTLNVDDELLIYGEIEGIKAPLNPYQFNYREYLIDLGITHQFQIEAQLIRVLDDPSKTVYGRTALLRNKIIHNLKKANFGEEELGIIQALLLGQRNDISGNTYQDYKNAGAVHILAVSGLHIGILLLILEFLLRPLEYLPKGKTIKLITIVILLWAFAFLAGLSASVIRAVTMFTFVAYALYLNRPSNTFNILALSMFFILLLINPMLLFQVGFQMSYAAVFAIVWIYPLLQKFWYPKNWLVRKVWQLLSVSLAAQLGVLPLSLYYFHQFPGLFFISNVLIIPFLGIILGMGILVIVLSFLNKLPDFIVHIYNGLIGAMNEIIGWVAQQEAFVFKNIPFDRVQMILTYGIFICLVLVTTKMTFRRTFTFLSAVIVLQAWLFYVSYQNQGKESLWVAHQARNSILMYRSGTKLSIFTTDIYPAKDISQDYQIAERIDSIKFHLLKNSYRIQDKTLMVVDSHGIISTGEQPDYLLLTQSPKINLERLIDSKPPLFIIADGSNFKSYIERWKKTCTKRKLPFHFTGEKGAFYFKNAQSQ